VSRQGAPGEGVAGAGRGGVAGRPWRLEEGVGGPGEARSLGRKGPAAGVRADRGPGRLVSANPLASDQFRHDFSSVRDSAWRIARRAGAVYASRDFGEQRVIPARAWHRGASASS
jgi:hypothetical protein